MTRTPWLLGLLALVAACKGDTAVVDYNGAPTVALFDPTDGSTFEEGEAITFKGKVQDDAPLTELEIQWSSSVDGTLVSVDPPDEQGNVSLSTSNLTQGEHLITLRAFDAEGENAEASLTVIVEDVPEAPSIQVIHPSTTEQGLENTLFTFEVTCDDRQDAPESLVVHMTATGQTTSMTAECTMFPGGDGHASCTPTTPFPADNYTLLFEVTDTDHNMATANRNFSVLSALDYDFDGDGVTARLGDCDDNNKLVYPGATEACDGLDNDCNPSTPTDGPNLPCWDDDGDGYCETGACANASGTIPDCNDANPNVYPSTVPELPNHLDDDCDGVIDEGTVNYDDDGDTYCESGDCENTTNTQHDCLDTDASAYPGNKETCDPGQVDNDCDGEWNKQNATGCTNFYTDADGDTYGAKGGSAQCWCAPGHAPYTGTNNTDCLDSNNQVHPGQTAFFAFERGDGKYDYNCDGSSEKQWTGTTTGCIASFSNLSCDVGSSGWQGSEKACGTSGNYLDSCGTTIGSIFACLDCYQYLTAAACNDCIICQAEPQNRTQACR